MRAVRRSSGAVLAVMAALALLLGGCGSDNTVYGAHTAAIGDTQAILGWNIAVANLRFADDRVLVDVTAAPSSEDPDAPRADPGDLRFGLYGALAHPIEATGIGSCESMTGAEAPAAMLRVQDGDRISGTVCLGPSRAQSQVRGIYLYSPRERIPETTVAYPAAFPLGLPRTGVADTGLIMASTSAEAWRADGMPLTPAALGDPVAFTGDGAMLLGLRAEAVAAQYRDDAAARGGPLMIVVAPTRPPPGVNPACNAYGASTLVLPDATLDSVVLDVSLCTQGEINQAVLYPTVSVIGTHAALWTTK